MVKKRRNHGRKGGAHGRGKARPVLCDGCGGRPRKDKAIQRFVVKNLVEASALRDLAEASCVENYVLPKQYLKIRYCISCAVHRRTVRVRPKEERRVRTVPRAPRRGERDMEGILLGTRGELGAGRPGGDRRA
ncbi:hypothetical protein CCYA_CCYA08G2402 [Cyanidiococcus yangmingshanensis]|nr:hypothetical protein CCYA_CCYA08G2402 [Cyanidiococcus yangmingshanensis]